MATKKYDWFNISDQQREQWEKLCPPNEYRVKMPSDLPEILPKSLTDKYANVLVLASGSVDNTTVYYMANGNRIDYKAAQIDQQPFGLAFVGNSPIPSGVLIQHGDWEDRSVTPPLEFWRSVTASGLNTVCPFSEMPTNDSGKLSDFKIQSHIDAFNDLVSKLRESADGLNEPAGKEEMRGEVQNARKEIEELGGLKAFKSGNWLLALVRKSFQNYWDRANARSFHKKYKNADNASIANRLIKTASRNAGILGAVTGTAVSTDELVAFFTGGELGVGDTC